ncbi:toxic anion resistance protein [Deinococcus radiophilus]|uniref:Toxic anion resistance protein n=1 Tax=Deinococcus radiophilus TaxID=32062 RepID=A0A3S0K3W1_9DEIO|nr:toxic anion resistance protein [Deinococcus radiophilus]RTR19413.1 toxic anion resistance protein [Deinococcus radiophilus]UFA50238.1 toxic anion resistance protein [Deinococcus radiophilus]
MTDRSDLPDLIPPAPVLEAPAPVPIIAPEQGDEMVKLNEADKLALQQKAEQFVTGLLRGDSQSLNFTEGTRSLHNLGQEEIRKASSVSSRLMERPMATQKGLKEGEGGKVASGLLDLRRTIEDLDPSRSNRLGARKLLGIIPFGRKAEGYFQKYQSSQAHLNAILNTLYKGQDELRKDNASIEQEKVNLWELMHKLREYVQLSRAIDADLTARLPALQARDPEMARVVQEELLFAVRQRTTDLLTQLAVSVQGYMALDLVRRNNLELIKGVDRATTTTVSALRTAVIVSQALSNQKLVLDQITALNSTTTGMIEATSSMLRQQGAQIQQQASTATIDVARLQAAFDNIYAALDDVSQYRMRALDSFAQTTQALEQQVNSANHYLDRERRVLDSDLPRQLSAPAAEVDLKL